MIRQRVTAMTAAVTLAIPLAMAAPSGAATNVRLTNDSPTASGYVSAYTLATGTPYTDNTITECSHARGRQNEPSVAIDPANTDVLIGSSNDYCGVEQPPTSATPSPTGPIWLGYYRSTNGGASFTSSLVPGYPDDRSPYAALAHVRTASSGDPVTAWDDHGRIYMGSESSDDPAGSLKTFGDVWVGMFDNPTGSGAARDTTKDGLRFRHSEIVAQGSSAPFLLGKFNDKTAIEVDRTGGPGDGNVYFAWSRFTGNGGVGIYFSRSTDHGATWSSPKKVSASIHDVQFPDISVTGNGHVYVTFRQFMDSSQPDAIDYVRSTDYGQTFSRVQRVDTFVPADAQDQASPVKAPSAKREDPGSPVGAAAGSAIARDCGDFASACASGFTFFRRDTQVRSTADQSAVNDDIYMVYDATKPSTVTNSTTTYSSAGPGKVGQAAIYFIRLNGLNGSHTSPSVIDNQATGQQVFPDISVDQGTMHALWWDSRNQATAYSVQLPIGNNAAGNVYPALDVYSTSRSTATGSSWSTPQRLTDYTSDPNFEQFADRTVPFAGDYLWVSSVGSDAYGVWTDWRNTVSGEDPRETTADAGGSAEPREGADVRQCRTYDPATATWSADTCPRDGGLDQDVYGSTAP